MGLIICSGIFLGVSQVKATTGGPTFIYNLTFNPADSSVYFLERSEGGKGCPPELKKISLLDEIITDVISCDMAGMLDKSELDLEINTITSNFKDVTMLLLPRNSIAFDVSQVRTEMLSDGWVSRTEFLVTVYQNGKQIGQFPATGCSANQPFVFGGYLARGITKKFILILSTKGDCFEGGYSKDTIHVINGITIEDKSSYGDAKSDKPLTKNEATIVVNIADQSTKTTATPTSQYTQDLPVYSSSDSKRSTTDVTTAILAAAFTILGVVLGYHIKK